MTGYSGAAAIEYLLENLEADDPARCCWRAAPRAGRLPDGTVTRFVDYLARNDDRVVVDELCPWHQQYYSLRLPFYRPYDAPIGHRLVVFGGSTNSES